MNIYNFYEKPASPMCVESIKFYASSTAETFDDFMGMDAEMKITIVKLDEEGKLTDEVIAEMPFTFENIVDYSEGTAASSPYTFFATFEVSKKEVDDFGTEFNVPVIINDPFAVIIGDFSRPDVNFGLYMCDVMETEQDYYYNDGIVPTCAEYVKESDGSPIDGLWYCQSLPPSSQYARQYNGVVFFNCMYDVVRLYDGFEKMTAPVEGGDCYAVVEEENEETGEMEEQAYGFIQYQSTMPRLSDWEGLEGEENYYFEDLPDWLEVGESNDSYYKSTDPNYLDPCITLTQLIAAPLPEGVKGRKAEIRIVSDRGADSGIITVIQGEVEEEAEDYVTEINVEREIGKGYGVTTYEPDFTGAMLYLGISNPTDGTIVGINADGSEEAAPGPGGIDGWCDADGNFIGWGKEDTRICVKFFPSVPQYEICDMNGADEVGKTYTVKYGLKANGKMATFVINVKFVKSQEVELSLSENVIKARVEYETDEVSYVERKVELTDDQVNEIIADLGLASLADATVYGWNPTTEEFVKSYAAYDGWRDANGDFKNWSGNAEVPACVKYTDGKTYLCYNITGCEPQEIKCYWAIANDKRAVLVEITFAYVVPAGINGINADSKADTIYNINGIRTKNMNQKGVYIQNGKKVLVK